MSQIQPGQIIKHKYRVDSYIAAGGMGAVFKVWDMERSAALAMKVLHGELAEDPSARKMFLREAQALEQLAHPNIVPFYGLSQQEENVFLLEQYINGITLKEMLAKRRGNPYSALEALIYLRAMCAALGYAHKQGVVHCDVKPGNIMIEQSGQIFLADFGIARHIEGGTMTLAGAGTPRYMSPEHILGRPVTAASDIYSLGVVLFELLTGRTPFTGDALESQSLKIDAGSTATERIRQAHLSLPVPDPCSLNPKIPAALGQVVLKALAKSPSERFASMSDMLLAACAAVGVSPDRVPERVAPLALPPVLAAPTAGEIARKPKKGFFRLTNPAFIGLFLLCVGLIGGAAVLGSALLSGPAPAIQGVQDGHVTQAVKTALVVETRIAQGELPAQANPVMVQQLNTAPPKMTEAPATPTPLPPPPSEPVAVQLPLPTAVSQSSNCAISRLTVGDWGYAAFGMGPLPIYKRAGANKILDMQEGEVFEIIDGPVCVNDRQYWKVYTQGHGGAEFDKGGEGWIAENESSTYRLEPGVWTDTVCGGFKSRLQVGGFATVGFFPDTANWLYSSLEVNADGKVFPGQAVEILEGPHCGTTKVLWYVRVLKTGQKGWTAEGKGNDHYLMPIITPTPIPQPDAAGGDDYACVYRLLEGDTVITIFRDYMAFQMKGFYRYTCQPDMTPTNCFNKQPIVNVNELLTGWYLLRSDLPTKEACVAPNFWVLVAP